MRKIIALLQKKLKNSTKIENVKNGKQNSALGRIKSVENQASNKFGDRLPFDLLGRSTEPHRL